MKRTGGIWIILAALGGCASPESKLEMGKTNGFTVHTPATVPGVQGPWGQPVTVMPASMTNSSSGVVQAGGTASPGGVMKADYRPGNGQPGASVTAPPPGYAPDSMVGMDHSAHGMGAGMGMAPPGYGPGGMPGMTGVGIPAGVVAGVGFVNGGPVSFQAQRTSVRFLRPEGMRVSWYVAGPDGRPTFTTTQLDVPGRYNFTQGGIYRLKLTRIPNRPNIPALYPTLQVAPATNKTAAFLAHSSVPVVFTDEDFDQVVAGNYLVKVIYLPDPGFQDLATAGPDEIVSTRLDPGVNPVTEAQRRGTVLLVIRMGNIDLEAPNTPAMETPNAYMMPPTMPPTGGVPHAMNGSGKPVMIPQGSLRGSTVSPGQLSPTPRVLTPVPPANSGPQASTTSPVPTPTSSDGQSAAPPAISQDPSSGNAFDRRPFGLRRRLPTSSGTDNQQ